MFSQFIQPYLFNPFNNNKIHFLFCNNISKHPVPSYSTSNLKYKKPCGQSSIKAIYKGVPGKKGKLNMITSAVANKYAVVRSFVSSLIVVLSSFFFWKI